MDGQDLAQTDAGSDENDIRFRLLLDTLPFIAFVISPLGEAEHYNQYFIDYHGEPPGHDPPARTRLLHPEDQPRLIAARDAAASVVREYVLEARLRRHDGAYRWHRLHSKPLLRGDALVGWLGSAIDIHDVVRANEILEQRVAARTEELEALNRHLTAEIQQRRQIEDGLRASETRYRRLYNRTPMALHSTNADARLIDVNDTWLSLFGYERQDVLGRCPADFMTAESATRYRDQAWPEMLASSGELRVVDYQFQTRSGRVFNGRLAAVGEFDADGRFLRTWSAIADVTAEKHADRELRQVQRMEAVGQLTAGIAHDFNNLLTAILGNLELLSKRTTPDQARADRLIGGARSAAQRGAKLTAQLLAFSRQQRIAAEPIDLTRLIDDMLPLLRSTIGGTIGINIRRNQNHSAALADPTQMELAILNLAINARDAMPDGGSITIEIADVTRDQPVWPEEPAPGEYVVVRVADTGTGIPAAVRERIFEPFFTTKEIGKGSGLGLPQVLGVAKQLGGGLSVRSTIGDGTCISIFLPRARRGICATDDAVSIDAGPIDPISSGRILLVDDDVDVRAAAVAMLTNAGYEVVEASSGAAALDALDHSDGQTALVVADIAMPGINGVEFAALVRRTYPHLPVLLMTGYADSDLLAADAPDVLRKPFHAIELEAKVRWALSRRALAGD